MRERPKYDYHNLLAYLSRGRNKNDRPTDKASLRVINVGGEPAVKMHSTTIARFHENGTITVSAGSWEDSSTTRANIGEVAGLSMFSIPSHMKRRVGTSCRAYVPGMTYGVPFENGCIVRRGCLVWTPAMKVQGIEDIRELQEPIRVTNKEKAEPYYKARRELLKRARPMLHFISSEMASAASEPRSRRAEWFEDILFDPPSDEDLMDVLTVLVKLGMPNGGYWRQAEFNQEAVPQYVQRGMAECAGPSSWDILEAIGALDTVMTLCRSL